jgi:hypothetical protein
LARRATPRVAAQCGACRRGENGRVYGGGVVSASNAMLDFLAPMPSPNADDGPSALARARREWLERELARSKEVSPGREGKSGGKDG